MCSIDAGSASSGVAPSDVGDSRPKVGWYRDPTGRHELRRWDGDGWSEWVIDAGRRNFDDLDGCGGPPRGESIPVDEPGRLPLRRVKATGPATTARPDGTLLPDARAASACLTPAILLALGAGLVGAAIVAFGEADVLGGAGGPLADDVVRRFLAPLVMAVAAFEAITLAGLIALRQRIGTGGRSAWRTMTAVAGDEVLRGVIAFLLALFAHTFILSTVDGPMAGAVRVVGPWWLFVTEAALLLLVAPVVEERLFRGVILGGLGHRFGPVLAVLGQAALYGLALSWSGGGVGRMVTALAMGAVGAVFGWFTHTTHDLRPVIVAHAMLNGWFLAQRLLAG